jgi:hypothetical protein
MTKYVVLGHLGLGDHILCNGIYRHYSEMAEKVVIPVKKNNLLSLQMMLSDCKNVEFFNLDDTTNLRRILELINYIFGNTHEIVKLGSFGKNFLISPEFNYDESFYQQANVPFAKRWEDFKFSYNEENSKAIYNETFQEYGYHFVHDDKTRNFNILDTRMGTQIPKISPDPSKSHLYSVFDYIHLIKNAKEVHCIESSFAAFIDSIEVQGKLFCHRYARPETYENKQLAFTYRKPWSVLM